MFTARVAGGKHFGFLYLIMLSHLEIKQSSPKSIKGSTSCRL